MPFGRKKQKRKQWRLPPPSFPAFNEYGDNAGKKYAAMQRRDQEMPPPPPVSSASRFCRKLRFEPCAAPSKLTNGEVVPSNKQQKMKNENVNQEESEPKVCKTVCLRDESSFGKSMTLFQNYRFYFHHDSLSVCHKMEYAFVNTCIKFLGGHTEAIRTQLCTHTFVPHDMYKKIIASSTNQPKAIMPGRKFDGDANTNTQRKVHQQSPSQLLKSGSRRSRSLLNAAAQKTQTKTNNGASPPAEEANSNLIIRSLYDNDVFHDIRNSITVVNLPLFVQWLNAQPFVLQAVGKCKVSGSCNMKAGYLTQKAGFSRTNSGSSLDSILMGVEDSNDKSGIASSKEIVLYQPNMQRNRNNRGQFDRGPSIIPKAKHRRLQPNPKWLPQQHTNNGRGRVEVGDPGSERSIHLYPPKLIIHDLLGNFEPICFVFNTKCPPHNVPRLYANAPIMASPFLCGHPDMIAHAIKREKIRIREQRRMQHHKMLEEKMLKDGLNITVSNEESISQSQNRTQTNSNLKLKKVNLEPKNLSGYCENCRESYRDLNEHIRSKKHRKFAQNEENFKELQAFARSLYGNRSHRQKGRVRTQKKNKKWKTENENVHFCGEMDVEGSNENFVPRMERPEKHLPRLINATKAKAHRIKNRFTRERPTTCIGLEPSEQQEIVRNHGWSSNHSKNQKESMKYPVPPSKDGIPQKRKKRRRPYSSNDICHPRVRDADQENNQNPSGRPRYAKSANSKVFGNNKARRLRQRPVNYDNNRMNLKS